MAVNRRFVLHGPTKSLIKDEEPVPKVTDSGVLIKVEYCGICRFDVERLETGSLTGQPIVPGHEACGTIREIGKEAAQDRPELREGDRVVVHPMVHCGECRACLADDSQVCREPPPFKFFGFFTDGGFQDYVNVPSARQLVKVPAGVPSEVAAISACSALTAYATVSKLNDSIIRAIKYFGKARVLVVGLGGCSLWAIQFLRHFWANDVIICTVSSKGSKQEKQKVAFAKELGHVDHTLSWEREGSDEEAAAMIEEQCGKFDGILDFVGSNRTVNRISKLMNNGGTWVFIGNGGADLSSVSMFAAIMGEWRLQGSAGGNRTDLEKILALLNEKKVNPIPIEIHTFDDIPRMMETVGVNGLPGRAVCKM